MKLVIFSTELPPGPGGIGNHCYHVAIELARRGCQVTVVSPQDYAHSEEIGDWSQRQPFEIVRLARHAGRPWRALRWFLRSLAAVWGRGPDLLVATGQRAAWTTSFVAGLTGKPWVAVGHGMEFGAKGRIARWLNRRAYQRADVVVAVSEYTRQALLSCGLQPRDLRVILNGADGSLFRPLPADEIEALRDQDAVVAPEHRLLLTIGRVDWRKGQDLVIRAMPAILREQPDVHYVLVGLPDRAPEMQQLARELGVADHVHFFGRQPTSRLAGYYNACDLFVMASRHTPDGDFEGFGIAAVEAALCGKPSLVTSDCGLVEAVVDGETGVVVPPEDVDAIAAQVIRLMGDDELRRTMGQRALERARAELTWRRRGGDYHELLSAVGGGA